MGVAGVRPEGLFVSSHPHQEKAWNAIDISPEGERLVMQTLIDSIQIYPEPLPSGLILKSIRLKIPLNENGFVFSTIEMVDDYDGDNDEEDEGEPSGDDTPPNGNLPTDGGSSPDDDRGPDGAPTLGGGLVPVQNSLPNVNTVSLYPHGNLLGRWPVNAQHFLIIITYPRWPRRLDAAKAAFATRFGGTK